MQACCLRVDACHPPVRSRPPEPRGVSALTLQPCAGVSGGPHLCPGCQPLQHACAGHAAGFCGLHRRHGEGGVPAPGIHFWVRLLLQGSMAEARLDWLQGSQLVQPVHPESGLAVGSFAASTARRRHLTECSDQRPASRMARPCCSVHDIPRLPKYAQHRQQPNSSGYSCSSARRLSGLCLPRSPVSSLWLTDLVHAGTWCLCWWLPPLQGRSQK